MHLLAGLDAPTTGTVAWPAIGDRRHLRPGPVAVVFQAPSLLPPLDVVENVALPLLLPGAEPAARRRNGDGRARAARPRPPRDEAPEELSGGQAQRSRSPGSSPGGRRLILADEPTGQLDQATGAIVIDALIDRDRRSAPRLVVNTHDPAVAERLSSASGRCTAAALTDRHDRNEGAGRRAS